MTLAHPQLSFVEDNSILIFGTKAENLKFPKFLGMEHTLERRIHIEE